MTLTLTAFQALCGDCLLLSYQHQNDIDVQHFIIDAGYSQTYHRTLSGAVRRIIDKGQQIDLVVLTHTDSDHIGGVVPFINEFGTSVVNQFWMNHAPIEALAINEGPVGVKQGITLRDRLTTDQKLKAESVIAGQFYGFGDISLSILSPDADQYERFRVKWEAQEKASRQRAQPVASAKTDHRQPIETLTSQQFTSDSSWSNRSSIAFLLSAGNFTGLFTGDAHADVITAALRTMGYTEQNPVRLDFFKVSHHGSKGNTNDELLSLIDCSQYLVSTNGANQHQFPHKESLARIITATRHRHPTKLVHLHFTYNDRTLQSIFTQQEIDQYGICCHYPTNHENNITLTFDET